MTNGSKRRIVVGIDGSEDSKQALAWAMEQARQMGGQRGHARGGQPWARGTPGMHLGSVAGYCVHHAPCPVVVLRTAAP